MEKSGKYLVKLWTILLTLIFLSFYTARASKVEAIKTGNWVDIGCWDPEVVPGCFDTILIPAGMVITVTDQIDLTMCNPTIVLVEGELTFQTGKKIDLSCGSCIELSGFPNQGILSGGNGGGSSNWVTICEQGMWKAEDGTAYGPLSLCNLLLFADLTAFEANSLADNVLLSWTIATENNCDHYTIERSEDGVNWRNIGDVQGAGYSNSSIDYSYTDWSPVNGLSYYRLTEIDFNGNTSILKTISLNYNAERPVIYPNPVHIGETLSIAYSSDSPTKFVQIYSQDGKVIYEHQFEGEQLISIEVSDRLSSGIYIVDVNGIQTRMVIR